MAIFSLILPCEVCFATPQGRVRGFCLTPLIFPLAKGGMKGGLTVGKRIRSKTATYYRKLKQLLKSLENNSISGVENYEAVYYQ
ncbi:MAG: hypothetical protein A2Y97_05245 [Nitrospirae bacterium RBG_13_39_12]|nr:MAG: hypothetical protein A2Y97_05245 [Nitrospirae bacterium RBG_13_39_12]